MASFMREEAQQLSSCIRSKMRLVLPHMKHTPVFSHRTAIEYWGSRAPDSSMKPLTLHVGVSQRDERPHTQGVSAHLWCGPLLTHVDGGFEVVRPEVCWAQMAQYGPPTTLITIAANFTCRDRVRRVTTLDEIIGYATSLKGFHGKRKCMEVIPFLIENTDSPREAMLAEFLIRHGFGKPVANFRVQLEGRVCYLDVSYPDLKIAFEYQGAYHADVEQMRRDMAKHNDLLKRGWQIIYVTLEDFRNPAQFLDIIQVTVEQQHHLMGLKKVVR